MNSDETTNDEFGKLDSTRRTFIKRLAVGAAVGAAVSPVITSFSMSGLTNSSAFAQMANSSVSPNTTTSTSTTSTTID